MVVRVAEYLENMALARAAFSEAQQVLQAAGDGEARRGNVSYANQVLASGFKHLEVAARRFMHIHAQDGSAARAVAADAAFRRAVLACADAFDEATGFVDVAAQRIAPVLRRWLDDPSAAPLLATQADAAGRQAKFRASKAAA